METAVAKTKRGKTMSSTPYESAIYQQPARLLQHLIRFNTTNPPGNEAACVSYIRDLLVEAEVPMTLLGQKCYDPILNAS